MSSFNLRYCSIILSFLFVFQAIAQNNNDKPGDKFTVEFVRSFSTNEDVVKDKSIGEKIVDWLFGEDVIQLVKPMKVIKDSWNRLLVLDQGAGYIVRIDTLEEEFQIVMNGNGKTFPSLVDICEMKRGVYLFTDSKENMVYMYNEKNDIISPFIKNKSLNQPTGIAYNILTKEVWVVETLSHQISIFDMSGKFKKVVGSRGTEPGQFNFPTYIWIDKNGIVYVIDSMNFRLQILSPTGEIINTFGEPGDATGYFARPKGVAVDSYGHIFIVDGLYNAIQAYNKDGEFLYYFGGKGSGNGKFWLPTGIFIDDEDYIYVADSFNSRIQIFKLLKKDEK